jgi:hypothetical protein
MISATEHDVVVLAIAALSADAEPVKLSNYVTTLPETHSIAIFIGAMARGEDSFADEVVDQKISISKYSLSASVACGKFCCAIVSGGNTGMTSSTSVADQLDVSRVFQEDLWDIV